MMRKLAYAVLLIAACWFAAYAARAAEIQAPERAVAGAGVTLHTSGGGEATFYLIGPSHTERRSVRLGEEIAIEPQAMRAAGRYLAIVRQGASTSTAWFYVASAKANQLTFLTRPSRVPVAKSDVISGVVFVFDDYRNLVLEPTPVNFELSVPDAPAVKRTVTSKLGVTWTRLDSTRKQGAAQFLASVGDDSVRRVVQEAASDPCNLRMKAQRTDKAIVVETDPVRDCSGNPVPDGTIVTFTQVDPAGRSTVDARIKKGVARAELPLASDATISVASGVVMGNEIRIGGGR